MIAVVLSDPGDDATETNATESRASDQTARPDTTVIDDADPAGTAPTEDTTPTEDNVPADTASTSEVPTNSLVMDETEPVAAPTLLMGERRHETGCDLRRGRSRRS